MNIFSGNSLWQLVAQSDAVSKFVLLLLFVMSIACWALFIGHVRPGGCPLSPAGPYRPYYLHPLGQTPGSIHDRD